MALVLKETSKNQKGMIVFTHKEWGFFSGIKGIRYLKNKGHWPKWAPGNDDLRPQYEKILQKISGQYYIGVHFGWYQRTKFDSSLVDFVVSGKGTLPLLDEGIFRIPLNSRNFTPKYFTKHNNIIKKWDVMTIARDVKSKNYTLLFNSIKNMLKEKADATFLIITLSFQSATFGEQSGLAAEYYKLFTREEQQQITFMYLHPSLEYGLNQLQLIDFYNGSKIFTLFSEEEGESRVISEALCCGLPVVVYEKLRGGGRDLLDETDSVMFDTFDNAHSAWINALDKFPNGLTSQPEKLTREDFSVKTLRSYVDQLYKSKEQEFDGVLINTDQLDQRLPAHYYDVPWKINPKMPTADIRSKKQFKIFLDHLNLI